jgi:hypothetical protein
MTARQASQIPPTCAMSLRAQKLQGPDVSLKFGASIAVNRSWHLSAARIADAVFFRRCSEEDTVKKITFVALLLAGIYGFGIPVTFAQDNPSKGATSDVINSDSVLDQQFLVLRKDIRSVRKQTIAANLTLTDDEAPKFWPVYEQYSDELEKITDTKLALIAEYAEEYGNLTDEEADSLVCRWLDTDTAVDQLRQKYVPILRKVLPGKKAATFFQLDRQLGMTVEIHLTSRLPLMQGQGQVSNSVAPSA